MDSVSYSKASPQWLRQSDCVSPDLLTTETPTKETVRKHVPVHAPEPNMNLIN